MTIRSPKLKWMALGLILFAIYSLTVPSNHSEAEDVYQFSKVVEQGSFADQAGVNRVLALPLFGAAYQAAQSLGFSGRAFPFMIFMNRLLAIASLFLFWKLLGEMTSVSSYRAQGPPASPYSSPKASGLQPTASVPIFGTLLLAFSYGFWRYANEAETYMLASVLVLGAWCLVAKGRWQWATLLSAVGILVHLLNLIPLLLIIPLYYLLSKAWKKALAHGGITGGLVLISYALCFRFLEWGELGAQHHSMEAGLGFSNLLRGGIAFGQCLVSGNFLFGFEGFREWLTHLFPSRMLGEEFFMAQQMPGWIKWVGSASLLTLMGVGVWLCGKAALEYGGLSFAVCSDSLRVTPLSFQTNSEGHEKEPDAQKEGGGLNVDDASCFVSDERKPTTHRLVPKAFLISCIVWMLLYAVAVIRTESGSPELWILALIPFWLLAGHWVKGRWAWGLVALLFSHNLIAGLLPILSEETDYHQAKGKWLVENSTADDLILTSYEPVMIFYLDYFAAAKIINSGATELDEIQWKLESSKGEAYAFANFFQPLTSMAERNPAMYEQMRETGLAFQPRFEKITNDEFGGIWELKDSAPGVHCKNGAE